MAKKKYRISKPNILGGSVSPNKDTIPVMADGGQAATDQDQLQAFMLTVYNLFKDGMTEEDVELQLISQNIPYDFVQKTITTVKKYMESIGEINEPVNPNTNFSGIETPEPSEEESALKQKNDQLMASYGQQSQEAALEEDEDDLIFQDNPYMKKGGKVSRKKFMKNILKRFEEGGAEKPDLKSGPKKDTLEKDVEKATKGFTSAVQGKAKEALSKEIYKLSEQSGDPKLQEMLMSGDQQQQPMQPMAREGMMVDDDYCECEDGSYSPECCSPDVRDYVETEYDRYNQQMMDFGDDPSKIGRKLVVERDTDLIRNYMGANEIEGFEVTPTKGFYKGLPLLGYEDMSEVEMDKEYSRAYLNKLYSEKDPRVMAKLQGLDAALEGENDGSDIPAALDRYYPPKQQYGGMQYAKTGDEMRKQIKNNPKKGQHMASFLMNNPVPTEEEGDIKIDPEYGDVVYKDKYVNLPYQSYGLRDLLFPANRSLGYRPKYYVDPRLGKPVARDVYGRTLFGGKKYIDYYEMPDEDFDPEILRRKDINRRARQGNKAIRRTLRGKGPIANALEKLENSLNGGMQVEEENFVDATDSSEFDRGKTRRAIRRGKRQSKRQMGLAGKGTLGSRGLRPVTQADINAATNAELERIMNEPAGNDGQAPILETMMDNSTDFNAPDVQSIDNQFIQYMADPRSQAGRFSYGTGGALDKFVLGGFDPTSMFQIRQNIDDEVNRQLDDPNFYENNQKIIDETFEGPQPYEEYEDNMEGPPMLDDKKKKKIIGIKNKDKIGVMGGQEFLNPFNAITNRVLGGLENVQSSKAANKTIVDSTDPMNMYQPETRKDKGDFDIYGNFRPDEQGFIGSTNNPGMTMSKYGGPTYQKGAIVEMDANELQQFMEAGGQIEFL